MDSAPLFGADATAAPAARAKVKFAAPLPADMDRDVLVEDVPIQGVPALAKYLSYCCFWVPGVSCNSCFVLRPREEAAILSLGKLVRMEQTEGCHVMHPCFGEVRKISTAVRTMSLPDMKVADSTGAPVSVSAILNYRVTNANRALLNVVSLANFVSTNAQAVLKQVVGSHSYYQLKSETEAVNREMISRLAPVLHGIGITVIKMKLNELNYAPEIASGMLKKQQAGALIEARKLIVEGAVMIAQDAVRMIERDSSVTMTNEDKVKIVTNLLTVTCSDVDATPTVSI